MDSTVICGTHKLKELDGKPCTVEATLVIGTVPDGLEIVATVSNVLRGQAKISDGKLTANLTSTMKQTTKEEMDVETALTTGLRTGFAVSLDDVILTLTGAQNTLQLERNVLVDVQFGEYTLLEFNGESVVASDMRLTILPSRATSALVIAGFKNSLRGELELCCGRLQGVLASTTYEVDGLDKAMEEAFLSAVKGQGLKVCVDGARLTLKHDHNVFLYEVRPSIPEMLLGEYVLKSFNGTPKLSGCQVTLSFTDSEDGIGKSAVVQMVGTLRGRVTTEDGKLKAKLMPSRTVAGESEMHLEEVLRRGFRAGFLWDLSGQELTLRYKGEVLVYLKIPTVVYENGKPSYVGDEVSRCFKNDDSGRMFRIINTVEGKWAFYNDTRVYNLCVSVTFGLRSKVEGLGNTSLTVNDEGMTVASVTVQPGATEMFITGTVNGYTCSYDAVPV
ncbi:hypothetical protein TRVL_09388 [Trypanosoma vivax]|nr:hypothetical protein TRVL_09388 [Trypanosoma vivax]